MTRTDELKQVADRFGTPTFLFDIEEFNFRLQSVREVFGKGVDLCFAMKANPFLISAAACQAEKLEVCSPGELDICIRASIKPEKIVYSGVNKQIDDIKKAVDYGVGVLTAESPLQVQLLESVAAEADYTVDVLLRLNAGSQFGMSRDDLLATVDNRAAYPHLNIVGIHYFVGTQRWKTKHQIEELSMLEELFDEMRESLGFEVERLEYGPGLPVPYFEGDDFSDTLAPAREIASALSRIANRVYLTVEMGRFFVASCGTYLTSVMDIKSNEGLGYCILDGGMNHLVYSGQMMGMRTPIIVNLSNGDCLGGEVTRWCLCGSLCSVNDVIAREAELANLNLGDVLAFRNAGAYSVTEGVGLFLSRTMPRVVLRYDDGRLQIARDFLETSEINEIQKGYYRF